MAANFSEVGMNKKMLFKFTWILADQLRNLGSNHLQQTTQRLR
jgi:hypothetical protein